MSSTKTMAIAFAALLSLNAIGAAQAGDASSYRTMRPLQGVSFDIGHRRAVSYYLREENTCKLVLTLAAKPNWGDVPSQTTIRFEAAVPALKATRYRSTDGNVLEFACQAEAKAMHVNVVEQIAKGAAR